MAERDVDFARQPVMPAAAASPSLIDGDWRPMGTASPASAAPRPRSPRARDPLHLKASPASAREERSRAAGIVEQAKGAIVATVDAVADGRSIDLAPLAPIVAAIIASVSRDAAALPSVTRLKERHEYTYLHSVSVCGLMVGLARQLGLPDDQLPQIGLAGLMHDIGKARVPRLLLDKPDPLTDAEFAVVREHAMRGHDLLSAISGIPPVVLDVCLHHHERVDGSGYPMRISGDALSIHARMGAICDVYDAVTSERAYKHAWSPAAALEWMAGATGHFDRAILNAFRAVIGPFPVGTLVLLESRRLAVVVDDPFAEPLVPMVCAFHCAATRRPLAETWQPTRDDPILGIEQAGSWNLPDWPGQRDAMLTRYRTGAPPRR